MKWLKCSRLIFIDLLRQCFFYIFSQVLCLAFMSSSFRHGCQWIAAHELWTITRAAKPPDCQTFLLVKIVLNWGAGFEDLLLISLDFQVFSQIRFYRYFEPIKRRRRKTTDVMLNSRNDYVSVSLYFPCETNISISRLIDKKQDCREQRKSDPY
jgi:hypothetical protein